MPTGVEASVEQRYAKATCSDHRSTSLATNSLRHSARSRFARCCGSGGGNRIRCRRCWIFRRARSEPLREFIFRMHGELSAHSVVSEAAELRAGDLPLVAVRRANGREVNGDGLTGNGVLLHAHHRQKETVDHILRTEMNDDGTIHFEMKLIERGDVVLRSEEHM